MPGVLIDNLSVFRCDEALVPEKARLVTSKTDKLRSLLNHVPFRKGHQTSLLRGGYYVPEAVNQMAIEARNVTVEKLAFTKLVELRMVLLRRPIIPE